MGYRELWTSHAVRVCIRRTATTSCQVDYRKYNKRIDIECRYWYLSMTLYSSGNFAHIANRTDLSNKQKWIVLTNKRKKKKTETETRKKEKPKWEKYSRTSVGDGPGGPRFNDLVRPVNNTSVVDKSHEKNGNETERDFRVFFWNNKNGNYSCVCWLMTTRCKNI